MHKFSTSNQVLIIHIANMFAHGSGLLEIISVPIMFNY